MTREKGKEVARRGMGEREMDWGRREERRAKREKGGKRRNRRRRKRVHKMRSAHTIHDSIDGD